MSDEKDNVKIVKNASRAENGSFGYSYASLGDMAKQGVEIPKMRVRVERNTVTGAMDGEFLEYWDGKEWQLGSRIILGQTKGSMPQQYGAGLTYARRYTTAMATAIATDDDKDIEDANVARRGASQKRSTGHRIDFDDLRAQAEKFDDIDELRNWYAGVLQMTKPTEKMKAVMDRIVKGRADRVTAGNVKDDAPPVDALKEAGLL